MTQVKIAVASLICVIFLSAFFGSFYVIDQGEVGVHTRFGSITGVEGPGFHVKLPFADGITVYSAQSHRMDYNTVAYSKDVQAAKTNLSVLYHLNPGAVDKIYSQFGPGGRIVERTLDATISARVEEVFGQYAAATIVSQRIELGKQLTEAVRSSLPGDLITVESVNLGNVDFSDAYEAAIESAMQAEAEVHKVRNELAREKIEAEKTVVTATAEAEASRQHAKAEADALRMRGEAEATAIEAKGKALRDNPNLSTLIAVERWNGALPQTQVPGATLPFIGIK